jgi:hypothetical protein
MKWITHIAAILLAIFFILAGMKAIRGPEGWEYRKWAQNKASGSFCIMAGIALLGLAGYRLTRKTDG